MRTRPSTKEKDRRDERGAGPDARQIALSPAVQEALGELVNAAKEVADVVGPKGFAIRTAVDQILGPVPVQRCIRHKQRNILDHLPEHDRRANAARAHDRLLSPAFARPGPSTTAVTGGRSISAVLSSTVGLAM